jgi:hypothetical protein
MQNVQRECRNRDFLCISICAPDQKCVRAKSLYALLQGVIERFKDRDHLFSLDQNESSRVQAEEMVLRTIEIGTFCVKHGNVFLI